MAENKKLTDEEIQKIKVIRNDFLMLTNALGEIEVRKLTLDNQKEVLRKNLNDLQTAEMTLGGVLEEKYGQGTVDLENGEFVTIPENQV